MMNRGRKGRERGSVYIIAVVTLLIATTLGLAMLQVIGRDFKEQDAQNKRLAASNLADAGYDYAAHEIAYGGRNVPFTQDLTLSTGTVRVEVTDDSSRSPSSVLITSTGVSGGYRRVLKRAYLISPYLYAWCQNSSLSTDKQIISMQNPSGMRVNGNVNLNRLSTQIATGVWATASVVTLGTVSPRYQNCPAVYFPDIFYGYYQVIADRSYPFGKTYGGLVKPEPGLTYVTGNVVFSSATQYTGVCTIVATGDISIRANAVAQGLGAYLALITSGTITIEGGAVNVNAVMYAHKWDNTGYIHSLGSGRNISGCMAADRIAVDGIVSIEHDASLTPSKLRQLRVPGFLEY